MSPVKKKPAKSKTVASKKPVKKQTKDLKGIKPHIAKVTVNIGVGEAGEKLQKAETVLKKLTGQKPVQTLSKTTSKDWALRKRMPIGCKVTLRKKRAADFLTEALKTRENKIAGYSFDNQGNFSFGVPDHTLFEGQRYDPHIGIFGMDICVTMEKPGFRIKHRRIDRRPIHHRHQVVAKESKSFLFTHFKTEVIE